MANPSWSYTCPYEALGVPPGADEASIRQAYRQKAKQYHPDVNKGEQAEQKFITIGQAYEFLVNRNRGKDDGTMVSGNSAAFHDWYWSFRMSRTWDKQQQKRDPKASTPGFASQPQSKEELRGQLAGLRQRAAVRKQRRGSGASSASTAEAVTDSMSSYDGSDMAGSSTSSYDGSNVAGSSTSSWDGASWHASVDDADAGVSSWSENNFAFGQQQQWQQESQEQVFHSVFDGPSDSGDPTPADPHSGPRRPRFAAGEHERTQLRAQLGGLRRRAAMKQQDLQQ